MDAMAIQINSLTIVYSTVYSGADQRKDQSSASLAFVNSPHKWPVTRKMFPFDDVIMKEAHGVRTTNKITRPFLIFCFEYHRGFSPKTTIFKFLTHRYCIVISCGRMCVVFRVSHMIPAIFSVLGVTVPTPLNDRKWYFDDVMI